MEDWLRPQCPHKGAHQFQQGSLSQGQLWSLSAASPAFLLIYHAPFYTSTPVSCWPKHTMQSVSLCPLTCMRVCVHAHSHTIYWQKMLLELADFIKDFGQKESGLHTETQTTSAWLLEVINPLTCPANLLTCFLFTLSLLLLFFFVYCSKFQMQSGLIPFVVCLLPTLADVVILFISISL